MSIDIGLHNRLANRVALALNDQPVDIRAFAEDVKKLLAHQAGAQAATVEVRHGINCAIAANRDDLGCTCGAEKRAAPVGPVVAAELPYVEGWSLPRDLETAHKEIQKLRVAYADAVARAEGACPPPAPVAQQSYKQPRVDYAQLTQALDPPKLSGRVEDRVWQLVHLVRDLRAAASPVAQQSDKPTKRTKTSPLEAFAIRMSGFDPHPDEPASVLVEAIRKQADDALAASPVAQQAEGDGACQCDSPSWCEQYGKCHRVVTGFQPNRAPTSAASPAGGDARDALTKAKDAITAAQRSHGVQLTSWPPQDPWLTNEVDEKLRAAIIAIDAAMPIASKGSTP